MKRKSNDEFEIKKEISFKIKYLYLFLTIGMVMYHARWLYDFNINYYSNFDRECLSFYFKFAEHIGTVCMVFFFFMSGFWFYRKINSIKDLLTKWKKRIFTLLIPFLLWSLILAIYKVCNNQITIGFDNLFYYLFETPVAGPLWYILALLILQLFSPLVVSLKNNKKMLTIIFVGLIIYIYLRYFEIIPHILSFKNWWWYDNMIMYTPIYLIGSYIGIYYPHILLENEYNSKKDTYIGIILLVLSFIGWHYFVINPYNLSTIYALIELIGIWLLLKSFWFKKDIPKILNCNFYIFALHNPVLIPRTRELIVGILKNGTVSGLEVIYIKINQIIAIVLICVIIKLLANQIFSSKVNYYLTGGRQ